MERESGKDWHFGKYVSYVGCIKGRARKLKLRGDDAADKVTVAGSASGFRDGAPVTQSANIGSPTEIGHTKWNPHVGNSIQPEMKGEVLVLKIRDMVKTGEMTGRAVELICPCDFGQKIGGKHRKASATNQRVPGKIGETRATKNESDHERWERETKDETEFDSRWTESKRKRKDEKESESRGMESQRRIGNKIGKFIAESIRKDGVKEIVTAELIRGTAMKEMLPSGIELLGNVHLDEPRCRYANTVKNWCDANGENEYMKLTAEIGSGTLLIPKMIDDVDDGNDERYWDENTNEKHRGRMKERNSNVGIGTVEKKLRGRMDDGNPGIGTSERKEIEYSRTSNGNDLGRNGLS